jgi:pimeloyl-ACP methyl ester carboxylesterase
MFHGYGAHQG